MDQCHHKGPSLETPHLTRPKRKGGKTRRRMTSAWAADQQPPWTAINSLPGLKIFQNFNWAFYGPCWLCLLCEALFRAPHDACCPTHIASHLELFF